MLLNRMSELMKMSMSLAGVASLSDVKLERSCDLSKFRRNLESQMGKLLIR